MAGAYIDEDGVAHAAGETFEAERVPRAFADVVIPVNGPAPAPESDVPNEPPKKAVFDLIEGSSGWYDIVRAGAEEPLTEKKMRRADAEQQIAELGGVVGDIR
jgi:hypothetical protein